MAYPWKELSPKDTLNIQSPKDFTQVELDVLLNLYQPLLKQNALSLYLSLNTKKNHSEVFNSTIHLSELLDQLTFGIPDFYQARIRLEALGLMEVFRHKEDCHTYFYRLANPLSAKDFFNDSILSTLLKEQISSRKFSNLRENYLEKKFDTTNYEEITRSFTEVFDFTIEHKIPHIEPLDFDDSKQSSVQPLHQAMNQVESLDLSFLRQQVDSSFVDVNSLTKTIVEKLTTYHLLYRFNELDLAQFILESADVQSGKINEQSLEETIEDYVNYQNRPINPLKDKVETGQTKTRYDQVNYSKKLARQGFSDQEIEVIESAYELTPVQYLKSIKDQKGGYASNNELRTLEEITSQSKLPTEVVNILINYVLVILGKANLEKNLLHSIANDWSQKEVNTPEKALSHVKDFYNRKNQKRQQSQNNKKQWSNYNRPIRQETMPKWYTEQYQEEDKENDQLKNNFSEQLKKLRKTNDED